MISHIIRSIGKRLTDEGNPTTPADVQAILWYPEKDLWSKLTKDGESNLKQSYDTEFIRIADARGLGDAARRAAASVDVGQQPQPASAQSP